MAIYAVEADVAIYQALMAANERAESELQETIEEMYDLPVSEVYDLLDGQWAVQTNLEIAVERAAKAKMDNDNE